MEYKKLRDVVMHSRYEELEKHITYMRERAVANLTYADAPVEIHRYQGQISILDQLLKLKANVINDGKK
tara:strand:- start:1447 stop:1653 length:207 start_codon:yes stop_codon:yes gene_type:complete